MERKGEIQRGPQQQHLGVPMGKAGTRASAASKQKQHAGSVQHHHEYEEWFTQNDMIFRSELRALSRALGQVTGRCLSVNCGTGLFEKALDEKYGIKITLGTEQRQDWAEYATKAGMKVCVGEFNNAIIQPVVEQQRQQQQEQKQQREQERQRQEPQQQQRQQRGEDEGECEPQEQGKFDTILMHSAMRLTDFRQAVTTACQLLSQAGVLVIGDVPRESSFGILYSAAKHLPEGWDHPMFHDVLPKNIFSIEQVKSSEWRTTEEKVAILKECGFQHFHFIQTLTRHPMFANKEEEESTSGCDRGDFVVIIASK